MKKLSLLLLLITTLGLSACTNKPQSDIHYASLTETYWKLIDFQGEAVRMGKYQPREIHFILTKQNQQISGFSGCNQFSGGYRIDKNKLIFSDFLSTMMACLDDTIQEYEFLQALKQTKTYQINGDKLSLFDNNNQRLAVFEAVYLQ